MNAAPSSLHIDCWPCLTSLLELGELHYVDYALAESLLPTHERFEETAALICYLSLAARKGHLCVRIDPETIEPDLAQLLSNDLLPQHSDEMYTTFKCLIEAGSRKIPQAILSTFHSFEERHALKPLCRFENYFYFQRFWTHENELCLHFLSLLKAPLNLRLNEEILYDKVSNMTLCGQLMPEQAAAILRASQQSLTIICGGPGTGKTYTAGHLIRLFLDSLPNAQKDKCKIALAAPTGKAAANLQKSLQNALGQSIALESITARTIHALLGIKESGKRSEEAPSKLNADLILIDECSMIDAKLMGELLKVIKPGARLILLGDKHQLPPVESGSVLADMITFLNSQEPKDRPSELKVCLRAELKGIVDFANLINTGDVSRTLASLHGSIPGITPLKLNCNKQNIRSIQNAIVEHAFPRFPSPGQLESQLTEILSQFNSFRILSPLRKGPLGVDSLNQLFLQKAMEHVLDGQVLVAPIMLTASQGKLSLFNGEVGLLVKKLTLKNKYNRCEEGDYALFPLISSEGKQEWRKFPALILPSFEYAYCLSVYKSQGSEFDHVLLLMPQGSETFGREVFYTAVTRARRQLDIWEQSGVIAETIQRRSIRLSGVGKKLMKQI